MSPVSVADAERDGVIERRSRGLYISEYTDPGLHFELAEVAKLYPNNPICLNSALFFRSLCCDTTGNMGRDLGIRLETEFT